MSNVSFSVPNLINGVSQQPDAIRFPSQCKEQINAFPSITEGLGKRPPTSWISKLINGTVGDVFDHTINRDQNERYFVYLYNNDLLVFDVTGAQKTVNFPDGKGYITEAVPSTAFEALTIADYTFILNKNKVVAMDMAVTPPKANKALVWVKQGAYDTQYTVRVENTDFSYTSASSGSTAAYTTTVANGIAALLTDGTTGLNAALVAGYNGWVVLNKGGSIIIYRSDGADFNLSVRDSRANTALGLVNDTVQSFTDLPQYAIPNLKIQVTGTPEIEADAYWVNFVSSSGVNVTTPAVLKVNTLRASKVSSVNAFTAGGSFITPSVGQAVTLIPIAGGTTNNPSAPNVLGTILTTDGGFNITAITINNGQYAYAVGQLFHVIRTSGAADLGTCTCNAVAVGTQGRINAVTVTSGGAGYVAGTYTLKKSSDSSVNTSVTIAVTAGVITSVTTIDSGSYNFQVNDALSLDTFLEQGFWQESIADNLKYKFDNSTMPHVLVREADGTFTFKRATWNNQLVGDKGSNPDPSFVGRTINTLFFFKGRLGCLSGENCVSSEEGEFFNYYRTTVTTLLDSDPIDVASNSTDVSTLYHAIPLQSKLTLFSEIPQFSFQGNDLLTPKTASMVPTTAYENLKSCKPCKSGQTIFFGFSRGDYAGIYEYYINPNTDKFDGNDITAHTPRYIAGNLKKMAASERLSMLVALADGMPNGLYVYKFYTNPLTGEKLQSAWGKFDFGSDSTVKGFSFIETKLYVYLVRADGLHLEVMDFGTGFKDPNSTYQILLDRRVTDIGLTKTYSSVTDATTITLPFTVSDTTKIQVVTRFVSPVVGMDGAIQLTPISVDSTHVVLHGNQIAQALWIGLKYVKQYDLTRPVIRETSGYNSKTPIIISNFYVRRGAVLYHRTKTCQAWVTPRDKKTYKYTLVPEIIGTPSADLYSDSLFDGTFAFPVMAKSDAVDISFINDTPFPCNLISLDWEGQFTLRSKRLPQ